METERDQKPHVCDACFQVFDSPNLLKIHYNLCSEKVKVKETEQGNIDNKVNIHAQLYSEKVPRSIIVPPLKVEYTEDKPYKGEIRNFPFQSQDNCKEKKPIVKLEVENNAELGNDANQQMPSVVVNIEPTYSYDAKNAKPLLINLNDSVHESNHHPLNMNPQDDIQSNKSAELYKCDKCEKSFTSEQTFSIHMLQHLFQCDKCDKSFPYEHKLKQHILVHMDRKSSKLYTCEKCDKSLTSKYTLKIHMLQHSFQCDQCEKSFPNRDKLKQHMTVHTTTAFKCYQCNQCNQCGDIFASEYGLRVHSQVHAGKPHKCELCSKRYRTKRHLNLHVRTHAGKTMYKCDQCDKAFISQSKLDKHHKIHTEEKQHQCEYCEKSFRKLSKLKEHLVVHTGKRPHQCDKCDMAFRDKTTLARHERTHTGEKPFQCDICNKWFSQKYHLTRHYRKHTGERKYQCDQCDKSFLKSSLLKAHVLKHKLIAENTGIKTVEVNRHVCQICSVVFESENLYKKQVNMH